MSPIFHWAQAEPTMYRDRSPCILQVARSKIKVKDENAEVGFGRRLRRKMFHNGTLIVLLHFTVWKVIGQLKIKNTKNAKSFLP